MAQIGVLRNRFYIPNLEDFFQNFLRVMYDCNNRHLKIDVYAKRQTASDFFILQLYYNGFYKSFKIY